MKKIAILGQPPSETQYWLEVIVEWEQVKTEHEECSELLAIFTSIAAKR